LLIGGAVFLGLGLLVGISASGAGDRWQQALSVWQVLLLIVESLAAGLIALGGVNAAVRADAKSGMHDSMRLMEASPSSIIMGYLTGGSTVGAAIFLPAMLLGLVVSVFGTKGVLGGAGYAGASALVVGSVATAMMASAFLGLASQKAAVGSVLMVVFTPAIMTAAVYSPPVALMTLPILSGTVFGRGAVEGVMVLSVVAQASVAAVLFVACVRKFKEPGRPAFRGDLGLVLLGLWTLQGLVALGLWSSVARNNFNADERGSALVLGIVLPALLLALMPVISAGRAAGELWRAKRSGTRTRGTWEARWWWAMAGPVAVLLLAQASAMFFLETALRSHLFQTVPLFLLSMLAFFFTLAAVARYVYARSKYPLLLLTVAVVVLMILPPLMDMVQMMASWNGPLVTLSELSPGGVAYYALETRALEWKVWPMTFVAVGTAVQVGLAVIAAVVLRLPRVEAGGGFEVVGAGVSPVPAREDGEKPQ
jgi:hypothetical protein